LLLCPYLYFISFHIGHKKTHKQAYLALYLINYGTYNGGTKFLPRRQSLKAKGTEDEDTHIKDETTSQ